MPPETRYAKSGDVNIAYQVVGDEPLDLVYVPGWVSNVELMWERPASARFLDRLASFSRLILFDKRGTGLSDRVPNDRLPTLEQRMDDVRAVMDAVGSERAVIFGHSEGANMSVLFAATYPERVEALVLIGVFAKRIRSDVPDDYPWAPTAEERNEVAEQVEREWGDMDMTYYAPSMAGDESFRRSTNAYMRAAASPSAAAALIRMNSQIDIRSILPTVSVPTLVLHRTGDRDVQVAEGRYVAERIPGARFVELPGDDHIVFVGKQDEVLDEIEEFVTGSRPAPDRDRVLATVLFTDIVGSTTRAAELGDHGWMELLEKHHAIVRHQLERFRGTEVDTAGDGFFATFDGPARAIRCALAIRDGLGESGLAVRAGVHTGEVELGPEKPGGIAVSIGARVAATAGAGEVIATRTVKDLVAGSGLEFSDRGEFELKGVPDVWRLYAVVA